MDPSMEQKLTFDAQWYQSEAAVTHTFVLGFYTQDNSLELFEPKAKKFFLRRTPVDTVCVRDLYPGSRIFVFGRKIHIIDYGNVETKELFGNKLQRAFLIVPGQCKPLLDSVFRKISALNLKLDDCNTRQITSEDLKRVDLTNDPKIADIKFNLLNEPSIIIELSGKSVDKKIEDIQEDCPGTYGGISDNFIEYFFKQPTNASLSTSKESVLCVIKPHIVHSNRTGDVLGKIYGQGFLVENIRLCHLDRTQTDDFLRIYEGVLPEFIQMSIHLASGPLLALALVRAADKDGSDGDQTDIHTKFRNLCGPFDSEIAKELRPHTLRAQFGENKICNAIHCTDLKEDVQSELDFFFN